MANEGIYLIFLLNILQFASVLFLMSAGLNLIYGVMRVINLAHGSLYALGAYVAAWSVPSIIGVIGPSTPLLLVVSVYFLLLLGALAAAVVGLAIEPTLLRPIYRRAEEYQLLATFGALLVLEDGIFAIWGGVPLPAREPWALLGTSIILGFQYPNYNVLVIFVGILAGALLYLVIFRTKLGILLRATSLDREMALAMGVNTKMLYTLAFALGSLLAGLGGAFTVPTGSAYLGIGIDVLVFAFVVVVVGGLGSLKGALVGSLLASTLRTVSLALFPELELALLYLIAAGILLLRPKGLFGK